jgi:hypothetical protein
MKIGRIITSSTIKTITRMVKDNRYKLNYISLYLKRQAIYLIAEGYLFSNPFSILFKFL